MIPSMSCEKRGAGLELDTGPGMYLGFEITSSFCVPFIPNCFSRWPGLPKREVTTNSDSGFMGIWSFEYIDASVRMFEMKESATWFFSGSVSICLSSSGENPSFLSSSAILNSLVIII